MPGTPTITTFNGLSPPWSLASLDANFVNVTTLLASANNYSNYLVDTGAANAYVVTFGAGITVSLAAGLSIQFKATNANTGASTLNASATGVKNIVNQDGSALVGGRIPAGSIVSVVYDGTSYQLQSSSFQPVLVQRVYSSYATYAALSTTIPLDDTIPQITEGTEILTATITPKSTSNRIRLRFTGGVSNAAVWVIGALFRDAVANALAARFMFVSSSGGEITMGLEFEEAAPSTSAITYRVRVGSNTGNAYLNGDTGTRYGGGSSIATLVVEEIS